MAMAAIQNMTLKYSALDPIFGQAQYTQIPMAVLGIVMKFFQIVISIAVGLAAGCIPVVGFNIGAGRNDRAKSLFTRLLAAEAIVGAAALLIVELFPRQLIGIFGAANESVYYTQYAVKCFRVYLCMMVLATVNKGTSAGPGPGLCLHCHLHGPGGAVRCGLRPAAPLMVWAGWGALFHAGLRPADLCDLCGRHLLYLPDAGFRRKWSG